MWIIKTLSEDMACNIREADDKINTALRMKAKYPNAAMWYKEMASAHLNFNTKAHDLVSAEIAAYKASPEYAEHPEYADGMMAVWQDRHADLVADSVRVKAMVDSMK